MEAITFFLLVHWSFSTVVKRHIQENWYIHEVPQEIPENAEEISNDPINESYGFRLMGETIHLFIENGNIYVIYENMDGVKILQSVEIPHGWNVREDFELMRYIWINPDDSEIPRNLEVLVFLDGGFLKLTFSSNWDEDEVVDKNFVRLVHIAVFPYSSILDARHRQTSIHQYAYDKPILFVSASQFDDQFVLTFEKIYFNEKFERYVYKVVLPLCDNVVVEYVKDNLQPQSSFFDYYSNRTEPNLVCCLEATISGESFLLELHLNAQYFDDTKDLAVYCERSDPDQNFCCFNSVKRSSSDLVGFLKFHDSDQDAARLLEIFSCAKH